MLEEFGACPELVTTATLGALGIGQINKASNAYQGGNFGKGSGHLLAGNGILTGLAALNELMKNGEIGVYTAGQLPFVLAGLTQFLKHHGDLSTSGLYQSCAKAAEKFTVLPALGLNMAIRLWLHKNGLIDPENALDWVQHLGFMGLSTSFVMPVAGSGKVFDRLTAKQERFLITLSARVALTLALGVDVVDSGVDAITLQDLGQADLLALTWMILIGMALKQDAIALDKETGQVVSKRIQKLRVSVRRKFFANGGKKEE